jgi:hypothetical protein
LVVVVEIVVMQCYTIFPTHFCICAFIVFGGRNAAAIRGAGALRSWLEDARFSCP